MSKSFLKSFYCRHLQEYGECRFSARCMFSHSRQAYKIPDNVCFYYLKNSCQNPECSFLHISAGDLIIQLRALQSYSNDHNNDEPSTSSRGASESDRPRSAFSKKYGPRSKHGTESWKAKKFAHEEKLCGICLEDVVGEKSFGLLVNCNHVFCYECLRTWRNTKNSAEDTKNCPECRTPSDHIIPSKYLPAIETDKTRIIDQYKRSRKNILCRYERNGQNNCRNQDTCLYKHLLPFKNFVRHSRCPYNLSSNNLILNAFFASDSSDEDIHAISILADLYM